MRSNLEGRLIQLEIAVKWLRDRLRAATDKTNALRQQTQSLAGGNYGGGGSGGGSGYLCQVTSGAIAARSGANVSSGTVVFYTVVGGGATATASKTGGSAVAYCAVSATTLAGNGIDANGWGWAQQDAAGVWWVVPLDCT